MLSISFILFPWKKIIDSSRGGKCFYSDQFISEKAVTAVNTILLQLQRKTITRVVLLDLKEAFFQSSIYFQCKINQWLKTEINKKR